MRVAFLTYLNLENTAGKNSSAGAIARISGLSKQVDSFIVHKNNFYYANSDRLKYPTPLFMSYYLFLPIYFLFDNIISFLFFILGGSNSFPLSEAAHISFSYRIDLFLKVLYVAKKHKLDIIQVEFPALSVGAFFLTRLLGLKLVVDEHNIEFHKVLRSKGKSPAASLLKSWELFCLKLADGVIVPSNLDKTILQKHGLKDYILVIPNALASSYEIKNIDKTGCTIIFHGSLNYYPNFEAISIIDRYIARRMPEFKFVVVGSGEVSVSSKNVEVVGFVEDIYSFLSRCDIAIVPLLQGGGTRFKILDYWNAALPVISTKVGAEGLDYTDGKNILIADTWSNFRKKIRQLARNRKLRALLSKNGKSLLESKYLWNKHKSSLHIFYTKLRVVR
ncbi:hypothetical protein COT72_03970 [archaeon CG10_big_fil_rev_8_21_14_0_10_43_11]|nr:MAG: hypothetical protein COT72_03970 [archaeon CG10_big_fil_rev_8_21_14_0_10_43_11]